MTKLQQTVKEQKKGSWKALSAGGRRGGGWAAPLILHHKHHSIFSCFLFFFKPGKTKGLRNVLERHSVDFALSKTWSLCFLSGTLTDAGCPSAPGYVYPEVEQAQQALHRLHLWHASSGEPLFFHARPFFTCLILGAAVIAVVSFQWEEKQNHLSFSVLVSHLSLAAIDQWQEAVSHCRCRVAP